MMGVFLYLVKRVFNKAKWEVKQIGVSQQKLAVHFYYHLSSAPHTVIYFYKVGYHNIGLLLHLWGGYLQQLHSKKKKNFSTKPNSVQNSGKVSLIPQLHSRCPFSFRPSQMIEKPRRCSCCLGPIKKNSSSWLLNTSSTSSAEVANANSFASLSMFFSMFLCPVKHSMKYNMNKTIQSKWLAKAPCGASVSWFFIKMTS